ncbi:hypothetical protein [Streptomyces venezuelae]|uniref:hypothetical protein n=1 Tax=Streptomyces venezuelae TaxID=54571 RepID=UPI003669DF82
MDAPDLAAMAARALSAPPSGAANTAASDLVRGQLSRSDRGRAALDALADAPDDPQASSGVQAVLAEEISGDAEFAGRLAALLHAPSQQHIGSVVLTGSKVTRSQIALGPLTINNTPAGRLSLGAGVILALLMVVLTAYGGVRLFDDADDAPRSAPSSPESARSADRATALPPTAETVRRTLPDRSSMDTREYPWAGMPEVRTSAAGLSLCEAAPQCEQNVTAVGTVVFGRGENEGENRAEFLVLAFPDADAAHRAYVDIVEDIEEVRVPTFVKVKLERRGEESQGFGMDRTSNPTELNRSLLFRHGAFIGLAHQMDDPTDQRHTRILSLSSILADRLEKANAGEPP